MPGTRKPVRGDGRDPDAWLGEEWLTEEDRRKYLGKWIAAYQGEVLGFGRTLEAAERRARGTGKVPPEADLYLEWLAPPSLIF